MEYLAQAHAFFVEWIAPIVVAYLVACVLLALGRLVDAHTEAATALAGERRANACVRLTDHGFTPEQAITAMNQVPPKP